MAERFLTQDSFCEKCKLSKTCNTVCVAGTGSQTAKVMLVFDSPSTFDDKHGTVLGDVDLLDKVLFDVIKADKADFYRTYAVKCRPKDGKKPTKREMDACRTYLEGEILNINPEVIITFGELSMTALTGNTKVSKFRGQAQMYAIGDRRFPVVCTYSPYYIMNTTENLTVWASDINKAYNIAYGVEESVSQTEVVYCDDFDKIRTVVKYIKQTGVAAFDCETPEIDKTMGVFKEGHHATMIQFSFQVGSAYAIPLEHQDSPFTKEEVDEIMQYLKIHVFENPKVRKIAHNLNYDYHIIALYGITKLRGRIDDTMLMGHLVDETHEKGLKRWVSDLFPEFGGYEDELESYGWTNVPIKKLAQYGGTDTDMTLRLAIQFEAWLQEDEKSYIIYRNLTMAAFRHLWEAERRGMDIDREGIQESIKEATELLNQQVLKLLDNKVVKRYCMKQEELVNTQALEAAEERLAKWVSTHKNPTKTQDKYEQQVRDLKTGAISSYKGFNFNSSPQLSDLLFNSKDGFLFDTITASTGKDELKDIKTKYDYEQEFIDGLLLYRTIDKILKTYLIGVHKRLDKNDRVHSSFLLSGTVTGRLSSRNPNFQNMPSMAKLKDEIAIKVVSLVKKAFLAPKGHKIVQPDYSQAELRIISEFANEKAMIEVYANDGDVHAMTASKMMGVPFENFYDLDPKEQKAGRQKAKAANFGLIYLISVNGFLEYAKNNYGVVFTYEEAEQVVQDFFELYNRLPEYHETYINKGRKFGWVRTLFGRRRRLPDIDSADSYKRAADERVAVNSPVQGTAGEFTIFAIALLKYRLNPRTKFVNTVHDSIIFYIPDDILDSEIKVIRQTMENLPTMQYFGKELKRVKMKTDFEVSDKSWGDLKAYEFSE